MKKQKKKNLIKIRRKKRIRAKIRGNSLCPRLSVFRSNKGIYVQLVDDDLGKTLLSVSNREIEQKNKKVEISLNLGKLLAKKALAAKIKEVVFDRGGYKYHGRIKAIAQGAREGGLKF